LPSGIITKGIGGFYYVSTENGDIVECKARGIFRKNKFAPLTGDRVVFSLTDSEHKKGTIDHIEPRTSVLVRPAVANVDQMIAVIAVKSPEPDLLLLDKLLVTAEKKEIRPVICINKTDLGQQSEIAALRKPYDLAGYCVIETNKLETEGFNELKSQLKDHISVFAGQSGVGKSTLLNRLVNTLVMETGVLSERLDRGKHTTRHAELIKLESGYIVDTPGFSSFELAEIKYQELQYFYPEFGQFISGCKFTGCSHINEPKCKVKDAMADNLIDSERYRRYTQLYAILKQEDEMKYK
jgi:ribosome biogenesis GTPase